MSTFGQPRSVARRCVQPNDDQFLDYSRGYYRSSPVFSAVSGTENRFMFATFLTDTARTLGTIGVLWTLSQC